MKKWLTWERAGTHQMIDINERSTSTTNALGSLEEEDEIVVEKCDVNELSLIYFPIIRYRCLNHSFRGSTAGVLELSSKKNK